MQTPAGRDRELAELDALVRRLERSGAGATVWVEGDTGMGKSALVAALRSRSTIPVFVSPLGAQEVPLGGLARLLGCHPDPLLSRAETIGRLETAMARLCSTGPVVLVAEDLHRADEASLLTWSRLARLAASLPVLLVSTSSPRPYREQLSQLREAVRKRGGVMLTLDPLPDSILVTVAERRLGGRPGADLLSCLAAVGGNPGAALGLLSAFDAGGLLVRSQGRTILRRDESQWAAILEGWVCRDLSAPAREIVRRAALAPARFDVADLARATEIGPPLVAAALSGATDLGILRAEGEYLVFRHEIVRDACIRTFCATERRAYDLAAATRLLDAGSRPPAIAHHLRGAGELPPEAVRWRASLSASTLRSDPALFSDVLRMTPVDPRAAELDYWRGAYAAAVRTAVRAGADHASEADPSRRLALRALIRAGRPADALALSGGGSGPGSDAHLRAWRAVALADVGDLAAARAQIESLEHQEDSPLAAAARAHAHVHTGLGSRILPTLHAARDALDPFTEDAEARELRVLLHTDLLELFAQAGPPSIVDRLLAETPAYLAEADRGLQDRLRSTARWAAYAIGGRDAVPPSEAEAREAEAEGRSEEALALRRRDFAHALTRRPTRLHGVEHLVRLSREAGADVEDVIEACQRVAVDEALAAQITMTALVRAIAARDIGGLTAAAQQAAYHGAVAQQAFALEEAAVCQAEAGDRKAAARALHQALRSYTSLGTAWDIARAEQRLAAYGIRRRPPSDRPETGWEALTPAESRVARLVARGLSNRAIAQELFLSQNTVQTHLARIRNKLGLRSRLEIARAAALRADSATLR